MQAWSWLKLCGNATFTVWDSERHTFGSCFVNLCLVIVTHAFLAVISSYHFSRHHNRRIRGNIPHSVTLTVRFCLCVLLAILPAVLLVLHFTSDKTDTEIVTVASYVIQGISWFVHSGFIWRLKRYFHIHIRGPVTIVLSFLATTVALIFHLYSVIVDVRSKKDYFGAAEEYGAYIKSAFHLVYLLTLLPYQRPGAELLRNVSGRTVNYIDSEREPLINRPQVEQEQGLGTAGDGSNCLSKLFFVWANPLMYKGYRNEISSTEHLFSLPSELGTKYIDEKFKKSLRHVRGGTDTDDCSEDGDEGLSHRNRETHNLSRNSDLYNVRVAQPSSFERNRIEPQMQSKPMTNILLKALNKTFGFECFLLGILKFLGDSLNFTGPILLNFLVSFMENSKEPIWHGYVYAAGLFLSTFLSSMFSIHFGYRISVLGLKVRASLITSVYKKALSVSSVALSSFTTGQVVNYMSTDTDRIVNFAPSFHQLWSLPLQVAVSLYLLYSQVGLAFLAGTGVCCALDTHKQVSNTEYPPNFGICLF